MEILDFELPHFPTLKPDPTLFILCDVFGVELRISDRSRNVDLAAARVFSKPSQWNTSYPRDSRASYLEHRRKLKSMTTARQNLRIYVVDDDPVIASTLTLILQHNGFDAVSFTLPLEALKAAKRDQPALIISDVVMPVLGGIELAKLLKRYCPNCRVMLFSGEPSPGNLFRIAGEDADSYDFLSKPIHPLEFVKKIRALIDEIILGPDFGSDPLIIKSTA